VYTLLVLAWSTLYWAQLLRLREQHLYQLCRHLDLEERIKSKPTAYSQPRTHTIDAQANTCSNAPYKRRLLQVRSELR